MDQLDMAIMAVAGFMAVASLSGLMRARHKQLLDRFRQEFQAEQDRKQRAEKIRKRKDAREKARQASEEARKKYAASS